MASILPGRARVAAADTVARDGRPMSGSGCGSGSSREATDPVLLSALAAVAGAVPLPVAVIDASGRFLRVTDAFATMAGRDAADLLGRSPGEALGELGADLQSALARPGQAVEIRGLTAAGRPVTWQVTGARLPAPDGDGWAVWLGEAGPATAPLQHGPEEAARLELMSRAADLLGRSLEPSETLQNLCDVLVPAVADHAFVDLHDGDVLRRVAIRHAADADVDDRLQRPVGLPAGYGPGHPVRRAFEHGEVFLVSDVSRRPDAVPRGSDTHFVRAVGATAVMVVPLRTGSRVIGTVALLASVSARHYDDRDVALVQEVADRAAVAVTNSLSYAAQRGAAVELQRALLPATLPAVEGLDAAWRYVPGTDGTEVGGDWVDVVDLPGGRVAVVAGDVMGRGLRAAAVMGQLRTAVRALAMQDPPPADLLTQLDTVVAGLGGDQLITCLYGVYDPGRACLTFASAGHLPPLLLVDRRCQTLVGGTAVPLGVGGVEFTERTVAMPLGATLALYTDGLVERRGADLDGAIARLCDVLAASRGPLDERCATVLLRSSPGGPAGFQDDVALLLVRAQADPAQTAAQHSLGAAPESVGEARRLTSAALRRWRLEDDDLHVTAGLLASELVTNAVRYAQGDRVDLLLRRDSASLWMEVGDADTRSPRMRHASPDDEGGRGLALVQALADAWGTRTLRDGKVVWVRVNLPTGGTAAAQPG